MRVAGDRWPETRDCLSTNHPGVTRMRHFGAMLLLGLTLAACTSSEHSQKPSVSPSASLAQSANTVPALSSPARAELSVNGDDLEWTEALRFTPKQVLTDKPFTHAGVARSSEASYVGGRVALWWSEDGYLSAAAAVRLTDGTWKAASRSTHVALSKIPRFSTSVARVDPVDAPEHDPGVWAVFGHVGDTNVSVVEISGGEMPPILAKVEHDVWVALYVNAAPPGTLTIVGRDAAGHEVVRTTELVKLDQ